MNILAVDKIKSLKNWIVEIFVAKSSSFQHDKIYMSSNRGWDRLRAYFWEKNVDIKDLDFYRNYFGKASVKARLWRKIAFPPAMRPFYDLFSFYMKPEHIEFLKKEKPNSTCRAISTKFSEKFPNTKIEADDYYDGRWLCLYAFDLTGDSNLEA